MNLSKTKFRQLSVTAIEHSPQIQEWLSQFSNWQQAIAKTLLSQVQFVSRDEFSSWLERAIKQMPSGETYALYSVRKLNPDQTSFWDSLGEPVARPGASQGSEDLVYSLVSNLVRSSNGSLLDHPSLSVLKDQKVRNYVLIDDSIGSGDRVSGFVNAMLEHPTFLSWWSFGWVKIRVISFTRPKGSEKRVIEKIRGSDHGLRKYCKSSKINFASEFVYEEGWLEARWGKNYKQIIELCKSQSKVPAWARLGYGRILSNTIFYHSVPNNIPGILWFTSDKWKGLMPGRALPGWLLTALNQEIEEVPAINSSLSSELLKLLAMVKRGVRSTMSIAMRLNVDHRYAISLIDHATELGLLTTQIRLTPTGLDRLKQLNRVETLPSWDHSLYIPSSWCAGRATVQPSTGEQLAAHSSTDSVEASAFADGDVGQASLERSDAKAAMPPFSVMPQSPALSRKSHDADGPPGSKER